MRPLTQGISGGIGAASSPCAALPARLHFSFDGANTHVSRCFATSPLKLLTPRANDRSAWAFTSSFGGGLLAGDHVHLNIVADARTRCYVGTQSSTKVYRSPSSIPSTQELHATLDEHSLLAWLPDPVCCFADAVYHQRQRFNLAPTASLILLDSLTSGRHARGERYDFTRYRSRNDIFIGDDHILADSLLLDPDHGPINRPHRLGRFDCLATLVLLGPHCTVMSSQLLSCIASEPVEKSSPIIASASPLRDGAILRVAGPSAEPVAQFLHQHLRPLSELLGDDPWRRKW